MPAEKHQNIIGPLVLELREGKGWTQAELARELGTLGWKVSESRVAKIESRKVAVKDFETLYLLTALGISQQEFWRRLVAMNPKIPPSGAD